MMAEDYRNINTIMPIQVFNRRLAKVGQEYLKKRKPFDEQCAILEFKDKIEAVERESERRYGFVKVDELKLDIDEIDLDKYGDSDRFELLEDQEDYTDKVIEGSRTQVILGHTLSYRCKKRGHGISAFIPIAEYNAMKTKKKE